MMRVLLLMGGVQGCRHTLERACSQYLYRQEEKGSVDGSSAGDPATDHQMGLGNGHVDALGGSDPRCVAR